MLKVIDISNWQKGFDPSTAPVDAVIVKATEGTTFVDPYCDGFVQKAKNAGKLWGFYHFAGSENATAEADYFVSNCRNYFGEGIPILDWEGNQNVEWVNEFVRRIHDTTGVWPWIYGNPWRFNQGGVEPNCARWVASYPAVAHPTFAQAAGWKCPEANGNVVAWQFCSDGIVNGRELDCSLYYGDAVSWHAYAGTKAAPTPQPTPQPEKPAKPESVTLENDKYKVTIESQ